MIEGNPYAAPAAPPAARIGEEARLAGPIRLTYVVSDEQNARIRALMRRTALRTPLGIATAPTPAVFYVIAISFALSAHDRHSGAVPLVALLFVVAGGVRIARRARARRLIRASPSHGLDVDAVLDDSGVTIATSLLRSEAKWAAFTRALVGRDGILLYQTVVGHWLPYAGCENAPRPRTWSRWFVAA